jgi:group I intron endonuclease
MEVNMHYTIYKIINKINNKIYIGKHQTKNLDDDYMGSGKRLKDAIKHYGIENFKKEILFIFDNESDMNAKESELVTEDFVKEDTNYNMCPGGNGGFGYINNSNIIKFKGKTHSSESKKQMGHKNNTYFAGKCHTEDAKITIGNNTSEKLSGKIKTEEHKRKIAESVRKRHAERIAGVV